MGDLQDRLKDWLSAGSGPPIAALIGFSLLDLRHGEATLTMHADERHHNPMGGLHGGVLCDLADAAMGVAVASTLSEDEIFTTAQLHINFLRPIVEADLTGVGRVAYRGRRAAFAECEITDHEGLLIAKSSSTCLIRTAPGA